MPVPKDPIKYEEWRRKQSEAHKGKKPPMAGKKHTPEALAKMSAAKKGKLPSITGKHHSDEAKAKMRAAKLGKPGTRTGHKGGTSWNKGIPCSDELKAAVSAANKGRKQTPEHIEKMATTKRGVKFNESHRQKISNANKGRIPTNKGRVYTDEEKARIYVNVYGNTWAKGRKMPDHVREILIQSRRQGKSVDTSIEKMVASLLDEQGMIYERQKRIGNYSVDFFIPEKNLIVEVNGCYWHGCEQCGFDKEMHIEKRTRDQKRISFLTSKGYDIQIIWEHELVAV